MKNRVLLLLCAMSFSGLAIANVENNCPELTGVYDNCEVIEYIEGFPMGYPTAEGDVYTITQTTAELTSEGYLDNQTYRIVESNTIYDDVDRNVINPIEVVSVGETRTMPTAFGSDEIMNLDEVSCKDNKYLTLKVSGEMYDPEFGETVSLELGRVFSKKGNSLIITETDKQTFQGESVESKTVFKCSAR